MYMQTHTTYWGLEKVRTDMKLSPDPTLSDVFSATPAAEDASSADVLSDTSEVY